MCDAHSHPPHCSVVSELGAVCVVCVCVLHLHAGWPPRGIAPPGLAACAVLMVVLRYGVMSA